MALIAFILSFVALLLISIIDWQRRIIPDWCLLLLFVSSALWHSLDLLTAIFCLATSVSIYYFMRGQKNYDVLGMGDIKFITIAGFFLNAQTLSTFFMVMGIGGVFLSLIFKGKYFPFGPAIALGLAAAWGLEKL